jgi:hypothetical protein
MMTRDYTRFECGSKRVGSLQTFGGGLSSCFHSALIIGLLNIAACSGSESQPKKNAAVEPAAPNKQVKEFDVPLDFAGSAQSSIEITPAMRVELDKAADLHRRRNPPGVDKTSLGFGIDVKEVPESNAAQGGAK